MLLVESHPGWTYVAGGLADQPATHIHVEQELARARAAKANRESRADE